MQKARQYLLSGAAVNTDAVSNHLDRLDPANAFIQLQPVHDNDVEGLLRQAHEATIINVIEESRKAVLADFYQSLRNDVHTAWEHQKQAVFDELARFSGSGDRSEASTRSVQYSSSTEYGRGGETYSAASGAPPLQMRLLRYNRVLEDLDARRKEGSNFDLIDAFAAVDADQAELVRLTLFSILCPGSDGPAQRRSRLPMLWRLISHLVRTDAPAQGDGARHVPERHFASAYAAADDSPEASELRARLTRGALSYLEE